jgi:hypothetical protein
MGSEPRASSGNHFKINALSLAYFGNPNASSTVGYLGGGVKGILETAQRLLFGGCFHRKMGWPIWLGGQSYRVCLDCGIKQLFDERTLRAYGPYSYQIHDLLGHQGEASGKRQVA